MNVYDACECAYKNRYEKGYEQGIKDATKTDKKKYIVAIDGQDMFESNKYKDARIWAIMHEVKDATQIFVEYNTPYIFRVELELRDNRK